MRVLAPADLRLPAAALSVTGARVRSAPDVCTHGGLGAHPRRFAAHHLRHRLLYPVHKVFSHEPPSTRRVAWLNFFSRAPVEGNGRCCAAIVPVLLLFRASQNARAQTDQWLFRGVSDRRRSLVLLALCSALRPWRRCWFGRIHTEP